jgi:hypothetical protein
VTCVPAMSSKGTHTPEATLDIPRPAEALQPNSPSCGNQPANISLTRAVANRHARQLVNLIRPDEAAPEKPSGRRFALPP